MATPAKPGGVGCGGPPGNGGGDVDPDLGELCGSSNPTKSGEVQYSFEYAAARSFAAAVKANPTGSQHIASSFGGVYLDDGVWELRMHLHDKDNLERSMMLSDITFYNLVAPIETEGYGLRDYLYHVRDPGPRIEGMEEIEDDNKLEEILDNIAMQNIAALLPEPA